MRKAFLVKSDLLYRKEDFAQNYKLSNKNYLLCEWRDFKKIRYGICTYDKYISQELNYNFATTCFMSKCLDNHQ